jgi:hypothetical protein
MRRDSLLVLPTGQDRPVSVSRAQVTDLQVHRGRERQWRKGLLFGTPCGVLFGVLTWWSIDEAVNSTAELFGGEVSSSSPGALAYGAVGALYGAGAGLVIGSLLTRDRWEGVGLAEMEPALHLGDGGRIGLEISIPLGR